MKNTNYRYCNIIARKTSLNANTFVEHNPLGHSDEYHSLGDKIYRMIETGEDIGEKINPLFDGNEVDDLDVTKSFRHDVMDIAEEFGNMPDVLPNPIASPDIDSDNNE